MHPALPLSILPTRCACNQVGPSPRKQLGQDSTGLGNNQLLHTILGHYYANTATKMSQLHVLFWYFGWQVTIKSSDDCTSVNGEKPIEFVNVCLSQAHKSYGIILCMCLANERWCYAISHWLGAYTKWSHTKDITVNVVWVFNDTNDQCQSHLFHHSSQYNMLLHTKWTEDHN